MKKTLPLILGLLAAAGAAYFLFFRKSASAPRASGTTGANFVPTGTARPGATTTGSTSVGNQLAAAGVNAAGSLLSSIIGSIFGKGQSGSGGSGIHIGGGAGATRSSSTGTPVRNSGGGGGSTGGYGAPPSGYQDWTSYYNDLSGGPAFGDNAITEADLKDTGYAAFGDNPITESDLNATGFGDLQSVDWQGWSDFESGGGSDTFDFNSLVDG